MNIILLSGGSGKRLWPLSNDVRSKQFIKIFKNDDGKFESMVQRVYCQIKKADPDASVTIATSKSQVSSIHSQLGESVSICVEPCRRDTFPAIALASAYLHDVQKVGLNEAVVVCPVDPYVGDDYFDALQSLYHQALKGEANLILMGIEPTYPSEKYGYIIPADDRQISAVSTFKEKPGKDTARKYMERGALWNGGVFAYKLDYMMEKVYELTGCGDYYELFEKYESLKQISFDYAVAEKEASIQVQRFAGAWKDVGTWNTMAEAMEGCSIGHVVMGGGCADTHVVNELDIPILCMGLKDMIVSASPDGILVSDKSQSSYIKSYVDKLDNPVMYAEKSWGDYRVIDIGRDSITVKVTLHAGNHMNYHSHEYRNELWSIISGTGRTIVDGMEQIVKPGDVITMQAGCRHAVIAETELVLIEVQIGNDISVKDKKKYEFNF